MSNPVRLIQTNFTGGQLSERLASRVDVEKRFNGAKSLLNMFVRTQGGAYRRPGTYFVDHVRDNADVTILVPFVYSTVQNYVIELGDQYARFYRSQGQVVESGQSVTNALNSNPCRITVASHGYSTGDQVYLDAVGGMTELNSKRYSITVIDANTFSLDGIDAVPYTAYTSGGTATKVYQITTPWTSDDLRELKFTQSADVLYVTHNDYQTRMINRVADDDWSITEYDTSDGPYLDLNETSTTMAVSATGPGVVTVNASAATFASTDVGRHLRIQHSGSWGWGVITTFNSTTQVIVTTEDGYYGTAGVTTWRLGAWSETTGWPAVSTFCQGRLMFGNAPAQPNTIWGSKSSDYANFSPTDASGAVADNNGITFTLDDDQVNAINWLASSKSMLMIGTSDAIHFAYGGNSSGALVPITPTNIVFSREHNYSSARDMRVHVIGESLHFVMASLRKVRKLQSRSNGTDASDITAFCETITTTGVIDSAVHREVDQMALYVRNDGVGIVNVIDDEQSVSAWTELRPGGSNAEIKSVASIPNPDATKGYDIWMIVQRTIDGENVQTIEYANRAYVPEEEAQREAYYVDCGLSYDGYVSGTVTPSATTGSGITFTASASVFDSTMVGDKIYQFNSAGTRIASATITAYTSATVVTCTITQDFASTNAIASGSWAIARDTFSGLSHLEGEVCKVLGDGGSVPDVTVSDGSVTLDGHYARVHIGLGFTSRVITMPPEETKIGEAVRTLQGMRSKIETVFLKAYYSEGIKYGPSTEKLYKLPSRKPSDLMDKAPPVATETFKLEWPSGIESDPVAVFEQSEPLPMEILHVVKELRIYG